MAAGAWLRSQRDTTDGQLEAGVCHGVRAACRRRVGDECQLSNHLADDHTDAAGGAVSVERGRGDLDRPGE